MQELRLIRKLLVLLGLCLDPEHQARQLLLNGSITGLLIGFLCITMEFILTHTDDMADLMYAVMQFITFVTVTTCYVCFSMRKVETLNFFEKVHSIVNANRKFIVFDFPTLKDEHKWLQITSLLEETRDKCNPFYTKAEHRAHGMTKWPPIIYFASFYGVMVISLINIVVFDLIPGDLHPETWYTFYKMRYCMAAR